MKARVGPAIQPTFGLLALVLWTPLSVLEISVAMFLNGITAIRFQAVSAVCMAVGAIVAKLWLGEFLALPGIIWGTIMLFLRQFR